MCCHCTWHTWHLRQNNQVCTLTCSASMCLAPFTSLSCTDVLHVLSLATIVEGQDANLMSVNAACGTLRPPQQQHDPLRLLPHPIIPVGREPSRASRAAPAVPAAGLLQPTVQTSLLLSMS